MSNSWPEPLLLGNRILWTWEGQNHSFPVASVETIYTDQNPERGWMATLLSENPMLALDVTWDPEHSGEPPTSFWLFVRNPNHLCKVPAGLLKDRCSGEVSIIYNPGCRGDDCPHDGECAHHMETLSAILAAPVRRDAEQYWRYVEDPLSLKELISRVSALSIRPDPGAEPS